MIYSRKGYELDNNKSLLLQNLQLRDSHTQHKVTETCKRNETQIRFTRRFVAHERKSKYCMLMNKFTDYCIIKI
jgi:hypothetical protein